MATDQTEKIVTRRPEETLWQGHPTHWNYFLSWFFGPLALLIGLLALVGDAKIALVFFGVGAVIILRIFLDRAARTYIVANRTVAFKSGILVKSTNEIRIRDVRSINVSRRGIAGMIGVGTVEFSSAATDRAEIIFTAIADAEKVKNMVRDLQDQV